MMKMAVCDLPDYSGFIHLYIQSCCKLSTALGQKILVSKMDVGKRLWIIIVIKPAWTVRPVVHFCFLWDTCLKDIQYDWRLCGCWCISLMFCRTVREAFLFFTVGKCFLRLFFLIVVSPHVWDLREILSLRKVRIL